MSMELQTSASAVVTNSILVDNERYLKRKLVRSIKKDSHWELRNTHFDPFIYYESRDLVLFRKINESEWLAYEPHCSIFKIWSSGPIINLGLFDSIIAYISFRIRVKVFKKKLLEEEKKQELDFLKKHGV